MSQRADAASTYVGMVGEKIIGYYTLVMSNIVYEDAPERLKKGLSLNPVPVMLLALAGGCLFRIMIAFRFAEWCLR